MATVDINRMNGAAASLLIGGRELLMSPLTDRDIQELDEWAQARLVQVARHSLTPNMSPAEREETLACAMRTSLGVSWMTGVGARLVATTAGMARVVWQGCKKNHPELTTDEIATLLYDPDNLREVTRVFDHVNKGPPRRPRRASKRAAK